MEAEGETRRRKQRVGRINPSTDDEMNRPFSLSFFLPFFSLYGLLCLCFRREAPDAWYVWPNTAIDPSHLPAAMVSKGGRRTDGTRARAKSRK